MSTTARPVTKPHLPSVGEGARRADEGGPQSPPTAPTHPHRPTRLPGRRLARDAIRCLARNFTTLEPGDPVAPDLLAAVNRLLLRGARALAHAPGYQRARPFPVAGSGAIPARTAVLALMKLAICIDPGLGAAPAARGETAAPL